MDTIYEKRTLAYLGCRDSGRLDEDIRMQIRRAMLEIEEKSCFRFFTKKYTMSDPVLQKMWKEKPSEDLQHYLSGCEELLVIASTLGIETERFLRRKMMTEMSYGLVLDAAANAWLETRTDEEEKKIISGPRTFRFAPGYGDIPLSLNAFFSNDMQLAKKIGITLADGGLFIPQKSMLGIIGLGDDTIRKQCGRCIRKESCSLRKQGERCWT